MRPKHYPLDCRQVCRAATEHLQAHLTCPPETRPAAMR
ncbi:hypothetical protein ElP_25870 [Tautonia plasticadhaerens]|uniref:Uncharacterized protein n=1 Tax=Tautonia plasticadhaerens TaxID=2527974 RepID=A0A518H1I3_9BACT|nr:hypothetical protein ElP_25870 [Tautonia plasticadhaerens]